MPATRGCRASELHLTIVGGELALRRYLGLVDGWVRSHFCATPAVVAA